LGISIGQEEESTLFTKILIRLPTEAKSCLRTVKSALCMLFGTLLELPSLAFVVPEGGSVLG